MEGVKQISVAKLLSQYLLSNLLEFIELIQKYSDDIKEFDYSWSNIMSELEARAFKFFGIEQEAHSKKKKKKAKRRLRMKMQKTNMGRSRKTVKTKKYFLQPKQVKNSYRPPS